jgi:hypothetical protein
VQADQPTPVTAAQTVQLAPMPTPTLTQAVIANFNALLILVAFVIVVIAQMIMAWMKEWNANAVRIVGISTIAFIGVFAALTVPSQQNVAAVFGLLGTIGGYLLGKSESYASRNKKAEEERRGEDKGKV